MAMGRTPELRIDDANTGPRGWQAPENPGKTAQPTSTVKPASWGTQAGATLQHPEPIGDPVAKHNAISESGVTQANVVAVGGRVLSVYDQLQAGLKARGVTWQRQETWKDGFKFTCQIPNPGNPRVHRTYEATAGDYMAAIQAVLEQIDKER
jgi:hypothetical protein